MPESAVEEVQHITSIQQHKYSKTNPQILQFCQKLSNILRLLRERWVGWSSFGDIPSKYGKNKIC